MPSDAATPDANAADAAPSGAHRPAPPAGVPWALRQTWRDLLFMHWPLPPQRLRALVPPPFELDTFDGDAWLAVVPFAATGVRARCLPPIPGWASMLELNVRTYTAGGGVLFLSLDCSSLAAVYGARLIYHLPYFHARMALHDDGGWRCYECRRTHRGAAPAEFRARYRPAGGVYAARPGTLEHWLTERYKLVTTDTRGRPIVGHIAHPPWPLQPAEAVIELNSMAAAAGVTLPDSPPLLHFARRVDMRAWPPLRDRTSGEGS